METENLPEVIETISPVQMRSVVTTTPATILEMAVAKGADIGQLKELMQMQIEWEKNEARKAYHAAMAEFKKIPLVITKDKANTQYKSMYTTIGNLINSVAPHMGSCGLSHKWNIKQEPERVFVECVVTHKLGHSDSVSMDGPLDKSGSKNPIQMIKSTRTYLQAATFESIMGLASTDANSNDDGNNASKGFCVSSEQLANIKAKMEEKGTELQTVLSFGGVSNLEDFPQSKYIPVMQAWDGK